MKYQKTPYNAEKLSILIIKRGNKITQGQMARYFGLGDKRGRDAVGRWERGQSRPKLHRRTNFIKYLCECLKLDKEEFKEVWNVLVEQWGWNNLSEDEWQLHFPNETKLLLPSYSGTNHFSRSRLSERSDILATQPVRLFICYKKQVDPDQKLATYLYHVLSNQGYDVFLEGTLPIGTAWLEEIDQQLKISDFLVVLLSWESANSEMIQAEVSRAYEYLQLQGKPYILPVQVAYEGLLPYSIAVFLNSRQYVLWQNMADNERVAYEILAAITGQPVQHRSTQTDITVPIKIISEDGQPISDDTTPQPPLPAFDPRYLTQFAKPEGPVRLRDKFYIEREVDVQVKSQIVKWGETITIRAPRQTGKTSLLMRGLHYAKQGGAKVVLFDFQGLGNDRLSSPDIFLRELAETICYQLRLNSIKLETAWRGKLGAPQKLTYFLADEILPKFEVPIILAMDEADSLLRTFFYQDFFGLVRSWHGLRTLDPDVWEKLNIVMVISTEPYLLIKDINQSPFNVASPVELTDFTLAQVQDLNQRHGFPLVEGEISLLIELLGGHPYLTRKALYTLVTKKLTWDSMSQNATTNQGPFSDHLNRLHWGLRNQPKLKKALKQVIQSNHCADEVALFRLLRAGLIKGGGNFYACRCDLYRLYFEDKLL